MTMRGIFSGIFVGAFVLLTASGCGVDRWVCRQMQSHEPECEHHLQSTFSSLTSGAETFLARLFVNAANAVPASYDRAIANVLKSEGGYTNDRADPGGPTNWGITIYDARKYWKRGATAADVRAMPLAVAKQIYRDRYWAAVRADELCAGLDYTVFDYAVNSGVARAGKVLRRVTRLPTTGWHITDDVISATRRDGPFALPCSELIEDINAERLRFLKSLHTWAVFGHGWGRRVASVKAISLQMANPAPGLLGVPDRPAFGPGKAYGRDDDEPEL